MQQISPMYNKQVNAVCLGFSTSVVKMSYTVTVNMFTAIYTSTQTSSAALKDSTVALVSPSP